MRVAAAEVDALSDSRQDKVELPTHFDSMAVSYASTLIVLAEGGTPVTMQLLIGVGADGSARVPALLCGASHDVASSSGRGVQHDTRRYARRGEQQRTRVHAGGRAASTGVCARAGRAAVDRSVWRRDRRERACTRRVAWLPALLGWRRSVVWSGVASRLRCLMPPSSSRVNG